MRKGVIGDPDLFASFYCKTIYYSSYDADAGKCIVSPSECIDGEGNTSKYQAAFEADFGNFYDRRIIQR